jgi:hypothetical protein
VGMRKSFFGMIKVIICNYQISFAGTNYKFIGNFF